MCNLKTIDTAEPGEPTNEDRANWALAALKAFVRAKGEVMTPFDAADDIADLITDLGHLAGRYGFDFTEIGPRAIRNWEAEK